MDLNQNQNPVPEQGGSGFKTVGLFFWDLLKIFIVALVIIVPFRMFVAEPFVVSGSSMVPTFHNGDYLVVDRLSYRFSPPKRGDVIVLKFPKDTSQFFIKRIIGLPGDTVKFSQGSVYIYNQQYPEGWKLDESYLGSNITGSSSSLTSLPLGRPETLGQSMTKPLGTDEYFVLGDNRTASSDSRVWGILPADDIVGRVWVRVFPLGDATSFKTPSYQ